MKSQVLHTVWCHISCEAAGEFWHWSLSGVKGLTNQKTHQACGSPIHHNYNMLPAVIKWDIMSAPIECYECRLNNLKCESVTMHFELGHFSPRARTEQEQPNLTGFDWNFLLPNAWKYLFLLRCGLGSSWRWHLSMCTMDGEWLWISVIWSSRPLVLDCSCNVS